MAYPTDPTTLLGLFLSGLFILTFWSYCLYKESMFYRFGEHIFVGVANGLYIITMLQSLNSLVFKPASRGELINIIPFLIGLLLYAGFIRQARFTRLWPLSVIVGWGLGVSFTGGLSVDFAAQLSATMLPLTSFDNVVIIVTTLTALSYFIFTREQKGPLGLSARIGRYAMMVYLGAQFGNTVMFRYSTILDRVDYMLRVLGILPY